MKARWRGMLPVLLAGAAGAAGAGDAAPPSSQVGLPPPAVAPTAPPFVDAAADAALDLADAQPTAAPAAARPWQARLEASARHARVGALAAASAGVAGPGSQGRARLVGAGGPAPAA